VFRRKIVAILPALMTGVLLFAGTLSLMPATVSAATNPFAEACKNGGGDSPACGNKGTDDPITGNDGIIVAVTSILAAVAGIVAIISLIWGGIKYIASNGDSSNVASAKAAVIAALIGLVIAVSARPVVLFVLGRIN